MIVNFCYGYFSFYCMTWMPAYLVEAQGLSLKQSGLYTFFSFAGIAIVAVVAGWAADRIIARGYDAILMRKVFIVSGFLGATSVLLGAYSSDLNWALFWNVFSLSCLGLTTANNLALCKVTLIPPPAVGLAVGVQQVAASLSGGVAAGVVGLASPQDRKLRRADDGDCRLPGDRCRRQHHPAAAQMVAQSHASCRLRI